MTMLEDGVKGLNKEETVAVLDIAEMVDRGLTQIGARSLPIRAQDGAEHANAFAGAASIAADLA
jgi:hypothetical protein